MRATMTAHQPPFTRLTNIARTLALSLVALMAPTANALADPRPEVSEQIDELFAMWDTTTTPGAAVIVTLNGEVIHREGYGLAQLEYGIPITPETVFHSASVSKQFTAFAIAMLAGQEDLDITKPIQEYVPEVPEFDWPVTLDQMLHHTSGLRDVMALRQIQGHSPSDVTTDAQIMQLIKMQRDLNFEPGTRFLYSNANYTLLAQTVERVSGKTFRQWTSEEVFRPLGMTNSHFDDDYTEIVPGRAYSYQPKASAPTENGKTAHARFPMNFSMVGSTGLLTTVDDLAKWMDNLQTGEYGGVELRDRMITRGTLKDGSEIDYAYGLNVSPYKGFPSISHGGVDAGFKSSVMVLPEQHLGIAILANTAEFPAIEISHQIADMFLPEDSAEKTAAPDANAAPQEITQKQAADIVINPDMYTGRFIMEDGSFLHITERDGGINLQVGETALKLYPTSARSFFILEADAGVDFDMLEDEAYSKAVLLNAGTATRGERIPAGSSDPSILAEYAGRYYLPEIDRFMEVTASDDGLSTQISGVPGISVSSIGTDRFINPQAGATLTFDRDSEGKIVSARASLGRIQNMLLEKQPAIDATCP